MSESDAMLTNVSSGVYCVDECRPKQLEAANKILFNPTSLGKLLVVDRMGGGKSHILRLVATIVKPVPRSTMMSSLAWKRYNNICCPPCSSSLLYNS